MDKLLEAVDDMAKLFEYMQKLEGFDLDEACSTLVENILMYNLMREDSCYYG